MFFIPRDITTKWLKQRQKVLKQPEGKRQIIIILTVNLLKKKAKAQLNISELLKEFYI